MNDADALTDRLHELGLRAPFPAADPSLDICRGRMALRRHRVCGAVGATTQKLRNAQLMIKDRG